MARLPLATIQQIRKKKAILMYTTWMRMILSFNFIFQLMYLCLLRRRKNLRERYTILKLERIQYIHRLIHEGPASCVENLRMDKRAFYKLCFVLENRGYVQESRHVNVVEKVGMFLYILGNHTKMRGIHAHFQRSTQSISRCFHEVLNGVLRLQGNYFKKPEPIQNDSTDKKWKHFKNCLGALDGTHIKMTIPIEDRPKYRNRRGEITSNVLGACSPNLEFQYVLTGWEGSAADGRVLRDAIYRHGLIVPTGTYYLVDAGYTNGEGFLAPYRGQRSASMESNADNTMERGAGKNKRKWTELEDEKLVESLLELVNNGTYKADNGFKPGYLVFLENSLNIKLPNSGLKGKPHIESRMKTLKKDFTMVYDLRYGNTSGFGWNSENQLVTASKDVWTEYAKAHVGALKWRNTPFPYFDDLSTIFGKDRATGHNAESAVEAEENINIEEAGHYDLPNDESSMQTSDESTSKRSSKKKKVEVDQMAEVMYNASKMIAAEFANSTKMMAAEFASSTKLLIAAETDRLEKKEKLMEELSKISSIGVIEKFKAAKKIADSENLMILFFGASDEEKKQLVDAIVTDEI